MKFKLPKLPKTAKKIIIWFVIVGVLGGGYFAFRHFTKPKAETAVSTVIADRGPIEVSISGSGQIEPNQKYEVQALVSKGEIIDAPFEEGTAVEQGTLLYKIDTKDAESNIERQKISLQKIQDTYNQNKEKLAKLTLKSKYSGTITNLYVKKGDDVKTDTKIADVVDNSKMILKLPFIADDAKSISTGKAADVTLNGSGYNISGSVTKVSTGSYVSADGVEVTDIEITVNNPGALKKDDRATAIVNGIACNDSGIFDNYATETILSETDGEITSLSFTQGDKVKAGDIVLKLSSETLTNTLKSNELDLKTQNLTLENELSKLNDYNITSPISGTVIQKTSKKGDILDSSNSKVVMATIADMSKIIFKMNVDELDIDKIKVGQKVTISADALPNKEFDGVVEYKNIIGTSSNGVTSYPVTIVVNKPEGLIPGMNVNAKVIVERVENVVRIPVSALRRGNMVLVKLKPGEKAPETPVVATGGGEGGQQRTNTAGSQAQQRPTSTPDDSQQPSPTSSSDVQRQRPANSEGDQPRQRPANAEGAPERSTAARPSSTPTATPAASSAPTASPTTLPSVAPSSTPAASSGNAPAGSNRGGGMPSMIIPEGYKAVIVRAGLNDKDYVEILSGISEGDEVSIPATPARTNTTPQMGGMGGMGGMGAPAGGGIRIQTSGGGGGGNQIRTPGGGQ